MATMTINNEQLIRRTMMGVDKNIEFTALNTIDDIEASELFEDFQEIIREWKRARCYMELRTCADQFRTIARQNNYNLDPNAAAMFIDIYWELV
jgi:hypothetical protein